MKRFLIIAVVLSFSIAGSRADNYPRNPYIDIVNYVFSLKLNDINSLIEGETIVDVKFLSDGISGFQLDLKGRVSAGSDTGMAVFSITSGGNPVKFRHENDRITINLLTKSHKNERRKYTISYTGIAADGLIIRENKFGDKTFFGDNWPDRCRNWLPVIDHPYDKAACEFIVTAPQKYLVIANGLIVEETNLDNNLKLTHWKESVPIPTYCMVFGAAQFAVQYFESDAGVPMQTWVYSQDRDNGFYDFARAGRVVDFFINRIGEFPYEKLANVQSKTRYGGMENSSAIFYNERSVTGQRRSEGTITHEIAHQWFGDSVTGADWNHIWLSEGFATYFTHVFNEFTFGRDRLVSGLKRDRLRVIRYHERNPESPVVDTKITRLTNLLSANSYQKGSWALHMLRYVVGDEKFNEGIKKYYSLYKNSVALTDDFRRVMEDVSGKDLEQFFQQWIFQPGQPDLRGGWEYNAQKQELTVNLEQAQEDKSVFVFPVEIKIDFGEETRSRIEVLNIDELKETFRFNMENVPVSVELDPNTWVLMKFDFNKKK